MPRIIDNDTGEDVSRGGYSDSGDYGDGGGMAGAIWFTLVLFFLMIAVSLMCLASQYAVWG